jgi:hypothetical protein
MTNETQIEVRIIECRFDTIRETRSLTDLSDVTAAVEKLLDDVTDADGELQANRFVGGVNYLGAPRSNYRVALFVGGQEYGLDDINCDDCRTDLDDRPGWIATGEGADLEIRCPLHAVKHEPKRLNMVAFAAVACGFRP